MKHTSRFILVAAVVVMAAIFVLPVSAGRLPSAAVFQSPPGYADSATACH